MNQMPLVRRSFTLVELLISITIIAVLSATALFAMYSVEEQARVSQTKASVARIHDLLMERWESYLTRPVPVRLLPTDSVAIAAQRQLNGLRELMRTQLPDRKSDVVDNPAFLRRPGAGSPPPLEISLQLAYRRKADRLVTASKGTSWLSDIDGWTLPHQGAECLYLILSSIRNGDESALDFFTPNEIGDVDQDGMPEILDGWGRPIEFLRWAPGFVTLPGDDGAWGVAGTDDDGNGAIDDELEAGFLDSDDRSELQIRNKTTSPDPFDPRGVDSRSTFALVPLVYSAGADGVYDILSDFGGGPLHYAATTPLNDPYYRDSSTSLQIGRPADADDLNNSGSGDGVLQCWDNITNHLISAK